MKAQVPRALKWIVRVILVFFLLLTLFRLVFYWRYRPTGFSFPADAFWMGIRFDLRIVCILGLLLLLLTLVPALNPVKRRGARRFWNILLTVVFGLVLLVYLVDYFHYDYLRQRLNASVLNYLQDAGISLGMVWQTYPVLRSLLLLAVLLTGCYFLFARLLPKRAPDAPRAGRSRWWYLPFVLFLGFGIWGTLSQFALRWSDVFMMRDAFKAQLALNPLQSFVSTLNFRSSTYDEAKVKKYYPLMADYLGVAPADSARGFERTIRPDSSSVTMPNVVLVICESFSAYKSSMWGNPLNPTPYFDSLCRQGVFFDHCFTPSFGTARGVWATITGIPDVESPKNASRNPALVDQQTVLNSLAAYQKYYFIGGSASWANIRGLLKYNIDGLKLYEQDDYTAAKVDVWGISDKNVFLQADQILSTEKKPFFAIIQTADNHRPYTIPEEDRKEFSLLNLPQDSLRRYGFDNNDEFNAFRYTDFSYRKFMEAMQKRPYFRNTIFVFVGDHGIRGNAGAMFPRAWTEQALTTFHVPLLFYSPKLQPRRNSRICSQLDVLPSVAGLLAQPYRNATLGRNLFDTTEGNAFRYSSAFIMDPDEKTIGMVTDEVYYKRPFRNGRGEMVSIRDNAPLPAGARTDSLRQALERYTDAIYQTARWMLYHNNK